MNNNPMNLEVPAEMRDVAAKSVDQARKAMDQFMEAARKAAESMNSSASSMQANMQSLTATSIGFAQQNIGASFDFAQKLVQARDVEEVSRLQADFVRQQAANMQSQLQEFGSAMQSKLKDSMGGGVKF